jgi:hypothetical protein
MSDAISQGCVCRWPDVLLVSRERGEGLLKRSVGQHLNRLSGRIFNGYKLIDLGRSGHSKLTHWRLTPVDSCGLRGLRGLVDSEEKSALEISNDKEL